ncbi:bestrophin family ion channel [Moritella viscosa]|nr:bestrophin family ion channel [Moritella viscosa]
MSNIYPTYIITPFTLLGVALSLFSEFRNSACYEPWQDAVKLWGQLIVNS